MTSLLYFTATWCGPCKLYGPVMERVKQEYQATIKVRKIDIDANPEIAKHHNISSVPTVVHLSENQEELHRLIGAVPYNRVVTEFSLS